MAALLAEWLLRGLLTKSVAKVLPAPFECKRWR